MVTYKHLVWLPVNTWWLRHQTFGCQVPTSFIMTTYIIHKLCQNELLITNIESLFVLFWNNTKKVITVNHIGVITILSQMLKVILRGTSRVTATCTRCHTCLTINITATCTRRHTSLTYDARECGQFLFQISASGIDFLVR